MMANKLSSDAEIVLDAVGTVLAALVPGGAIGGMSFMTIIAIAKGIAQGIPSIVNAYKDFEAVVSGGTSPTPEQFRALRAAVDAADDQLQLDAGL